MMSETTNTTFNLPTQCRRRRGGKSGHAPRGASTHFIQPF